MAAIYAMYIPLKVNPIPSFSLMKHQVEAESHIMLQLKNIQN